jgi:drug/metabolite transporter (DMT)-like permease
MQVWLTICPFTLCTQRLFKQAVVQPGCALHVSVLRAGMMTLFTKALSQLTSVTATALSTTANVAASGAISAIIFQEQLTKRWAVGVSLLVLGTYLLTMASHSSVQQPSNLPRGNKHD